MGQCTHLKKVLCKILSYLAQHSCYNIANTIQVAVKRPKLEKNTFTKTSSPKATTLTEAPSTVTAHGTELPPKKKK